MSAGEIIRRLEAQYPCPQQDCDGPVRMTLIRPEVSAQMVYACGSCGAAWDQGGQPLGWMGGGDRG